MSVSEEMLMCPLHGIPIIACCHTCRLPLCPKCKEHARHDVTTLDELVQKQSLETCQWSFEAAAASAKQLVDPYRKHINELENELHKSQHLFQELKPKAKEVEEHIRHDMSVAARAVAFLEATRADAVSQTLQGALARAQKLFTFEDELRSEFDAVKARCASVRAGLPQASARLLLWKAKAARMDLLARLEAAPNPPLRALVSSCDRIGLPDVWGASFAAFKGAADLQAVADALRAPLQLCNGVLFSARAVPLPAVPAGGRVGNVASLSRCGTLCSVNWRNTEHNELHLYNFLDGAARVLEVPGAYWACVFDGELFVGVLGVAQIHYAPLADAMAGAPFEQFRHFAVPGEVYTAALDCARDGWIVFQAGFGSAELVRIDLAEKSARAITCDREIYTLGSQGGVPVPGVLCVANAYRGGATLAVLESGRTRQITSGLSDYPLVVPSSSEPARLQWAAVFDQDAQFMFRGHASPLTTPVRPAMNASLVRLYRDVFLCLDAASWEWRALRIAVP